MNRGCILYFWNESKAHVQTFKILKFQNEIVSFMIDVFFRFVLVDKIMLNVIEDDPMNTVNVTEISDNVRGDTITQLQS